MKLGSAHHPGETAVRKPTAPERPRVPGYHLIAPIEIVGLGEGETWIAEGPGGFKAALRMIRGVHRGHLSDPVALEVLRRVRHPNLVATFGSWRVDDTLVLATELPDGSLWDLHSSQAASGQHGLPLDELLDHLSEAARGIDYLNGNVSMGGVSGHRTGVPGVNHGDIGPWSILLVGGGIKVADIDPARWGDNDLNRLLNRDSERPRAPGDDAPRRPAPPWSPAYIAPERHARRVSRHSDQYSLAVTYCRLRSGQFPFEGDAEEILSAQHEGPRLTMIPLAERGIVERAMAPDPAWRWPSCRAFIEALRRAALTEPPADDFDLVADRTHARSRPVLGRAAARNASLVVSLAGPSALSLHPATAHTADPITPPAD